MLKLRKEEERGEKREEEAAGKAKSVQQTLDVDTVRKPEAAAKKEGWKAVCGWDLD
jgi:hypothetical protein